MRLGINVDQPQLLGLTSCPKCAGSGLLERTAPDGQEFASRCSCVAERTRRRREGRVFAHPETARFKDAALTREPIAFWPEPIKAALHGFGTAEREGLWLEGPARACWYASAAVVQETLRAGQRVEFLSVKRLIRRLAFGLQHGQYWKFDSQLRKCDVLVLCSIDEHLSGWALSELYSLIDERYRELERLLVTSTVDPAALLLRLAEIPDEDLLHSEREPDSYELAEHTETNSESGSDHAVEGLEELDEEPEEDPAWRNLIAEKLVSRLVEHCGRPLLLPS
jgi:IstB-like ATP binding protein